MQDSVETVMDEQFTGIDAGERAILYNDLFTKYFNAFKNAYRVDEDINIKDISVPSVSADGTTLTSDLSRFETPK